MVDESTPRKPLCIVVGVGPGNGAAFARTYAGAGYAVALLARRLELSQALAAELPDARAYACDVSDPLAIERTFAAIRAAQGDAEVVVYNAGSAAWGSVEELSVADFEGAWRVNTLGAFAVAKQVVPAMKQAGKGTFVVVGATASRKGTPRGTAFGAAKAAQRSLAESLARTLWPAGIHVCLIVVDGVVDLPTTRQRMPGKPDAFFVQPQGVADTALFLTRQGRSAWSFEVEARPFGETW